MSGAAPRTIVIGIGNPDRGDDAAGRILARLLRRQLPRDIEVIELAGEATALLARLDGAEAVYLVDACVSGAIPGTVRRFDLSAEPLPCGIDALSTHGLALTEALELARSLRLLPARSIVYAVEGQCFELGAGLSPPVDAALAVIARRLRCEIIGCHRNYQG